MKTHSVENQPPFLEPYDAYATDPLLQSIVAREGASWAERKIIDYGKLAGSRLMELGFLANEHKPVLKTFDKYGRRIDYVEFHPAYHELMATAIAHEIHGLPWTTPRRGSHVARAVLEYLHDQAEAGTDCPLTMTFASIPSLRLQPDLAKIWEPKITSTQYDERNIPMSQKKGVTIGMTLTEKQGGSDVRSNTTKAERTQDHYRLTGHKWFCSAPMCDAFLALAQTEAGLGCFLLPRWKPDGTKNDFVLLRLKNKLGNWSNASAELELDGAYAQLIGEAGRGVPTIIEMVAHTRFNCMVGSTALMRQALVQAIHHTRNRQAFGGIISNHPLMSAVLADLAIEVEASLLYVMRVARALDEATESSLAFTRLALPIGKFWICKRTVGVVFEAQECLGGLGYVEDSNLPRLFRESPLNSIWEGSGNIQCLDAFRAIGKSPIIIEILLQELNTALGQFKPYDQAVAHLTRALQNLEEPASQARLLVEQMVTLLQAAQLIQHSTNEVTQHFIASRLEKKHGLAYGNLPDKSHTLRIIERSFPA